MGNHKLNLATYLLYPNVLTFQNVSIRTNEDICIIVIAHVKVFVIFLLYIKVFVLFQLLARLTRNTIVLIVFRNVQKYIHHSNRFE